MVILLFSIVFYLCIFTQFSSTLSFNIQLILMVLCNYALLCVPGKLSSKRPCDYGLRIGLLLGNQRGFADNCARYFHLSDDWAIVMLV